MALLPSTRILTRGSIRTIFDIKKATRSLTSKQLVYTEFGDPVSVVKYRECTVPELGSTDVLVRMLAAPINPADINTIQGKNLLRPQLPHIPGDEGVGNVVEVGKLVSRVERGDRVVVNRCQLGTWRYYGIFQEKHLHVISPYLPLPEASMITVAPATAYRMIKDFACVKTGESVVQNGANSAVGQSVIQLCRAWGINTINIVSCCDDYEDVKKYLLSIGATVVYSLEETSKVLARTNCTSVLRPKLALNSLGGHYEKLLLQVLAPYGTIVYYSCAQYLPTCVARCSRPDISIHKFDIQKWYECARCLDRTNMLTDIAQNMVIGKVRAPKYEAVELKNFVHAFKNTQDCDAFSSCNYVFDLTLP